jgi:hypothetical protein
MLWEEPSRKPIPVKVKRQVYKRAKGKCEKCGIKLKMSEGDFHHIRDPTVTPRASSVRFLCPLCHRKYGHKRIIRKVNTDTFWEKKEVKIVPKEVIKVRRKKPKIRKKAIRDFWGNIVGYKTVKIQKHKKTKKKTNLIRKKRSKTRHKKKGR